MRTAGREAIAQSRETGRRFLLAVRTVQPLDMRCSRAGLHLGVQRWPPWGWGACGSARSSWNSWLTTRLQAVTLHTDAVTQNLFAQRMGRSARLTSRRLVFNCHHDPSSVADVPIPYFSCSQRAGTRNRVDETNQVKTTPNTVPESALR